MTCAFITCTDFNKYDGWVRGSVARRFGAGNPDVPLAVQLAAAVPVEGDEERIPGFPIPVLYGAAPASLFGGMIVKLRVFTG